MIFDRKKQELVNRKYTLNEDVIRFVDNLTENFWDTLSLNPNFDIGEFVKKSGGILGSESFPPIFKRKSTKETPYMINIIRKKCGEAPYRLSVAYTLTNEFFFDESKNLLPVFNGSFIEDCRYYFACNLLMCKRYFFEAWLKLLNDCYEKPLYKRTTIVSISLSKQFNVALEDVIKWQNILKEEFIQYKKEKNNEYDCYDIKILAEELKNQFKSNQIDAIVKNLGGLICTCSKNTKIYPRYIPMEDNKFAIFLNYDSSSKNRRREFLRQLCNFFLENEATEAEMDLFADSFGT